MVPGLQSRARDLSAEAHHGAYEYRDGSNARALVALALGVVPNLPGFLEAAGLVESLPVFFSGL